MTRKSRLNRLLWSVRMRASRRIQTRDSNPGTPDSQEVHISGAEGLFKSSEIEEIAGKYLSRAVQHSRGIPDRIVITFERTDRKPVPIRLLPVTTVNCDSPDEAEKIVRELLLSCGISKKAVLKGMKIVKNNSVMHGASLILTESSSRVEPDKKRGVRVSRLGIRREAENGLSTRLSREGINTPTVKEALILASKVSSCGGVAAELCVSDDPDYTTGYVASRGLGYVRITNIKQKGCCSGGRVFFIKEDADLKKIIEYLEKKPVIAGPGTSAGSSVRRRNC